MISSKVCCTTCSLSLSNALVASSNRSILGCLISARAIAILCFCPPDICPPASPTFVLYPCGNFMMNSWAFAALAALIISSIDAEGLACLIFCRIDPAKSTGSWPTYPI
mmetsp:Transcript_29276/g.38484  ORF Transcript_29276/g.38484 Transcript_29276/m.38484 type:complete len:109 (-) Transcript_29276:1647-1973(-)